MVLLGILNWHKSIVVRYALLDVDQVVDLIVLVIGEDVRTVLLAISVLNYLEEQALLKDAQSLPHGVIGLPEELVRDVSLVLAADGEALGQQGSSYDDGLINLVHLDLLIDEVVEVVGAEVEVLLVYFLEGVQSILGIDD